MAIKAGVELALGKGDIPLAYFDAVTDTEAERDALHYKTNAARREAAAFADLG